MTSTSAPRTGDAATPVSVLAWATSRVRRLLPELAAFGGVGLLAFAVDVGVFNALRASVLGDQVILAKVLSVAVATAVAWLGHRHLTYRSRRGRPLAREALLFALSNVGGLLIAAGCLGVSHYVLGFQTALADNIAGNVVGLVLGTLFRFLCYRFLVFAPTATPADAPAELEAALTGSIPVDVDGRPTTAPSARTPVPEGGTIS